MTTVFSAGTKFDYYSGSCTTTNYTNYPQFTCRHYLLHSNPQKSEREEISLYFYLLYCTYGRHMQDTCEGHSHSTPHMGIASHLHQIFLLQQLQARKMFITVILPLLSLYIYLLLSIWSCHERMGAHWCFLWNSGFLTLTSYWLSWPSSLAGPGLCTE